MRSIASIRKFALFHRYAAVAVFVGCVCVRDVIVRYLCVGWLVSASCDFKGFDYVLLLYDAFTCSWTLCVLIFITCFVVVNSTTGYVFVDMCRPIFYMWT